MINGYYKLIYFLPIALITGPFLPDLIIVICSILFLVDTFRLKLFDYYNNYFFKTFVSFIIILNLSTLFSENFSLFKYSIGYLRYGLFSIFVFYVLKNIENSKIILSYSIIFTYLLLLFDGYFQFVFNKNIFLFEIQKYHEYSFYVTSFFNDEKKLGSFLAKMLPLFIFSICLLKNKLKIRKLDEIVSITLILLFLLVILTTERVSIFFMIIFILLIFLKSNNFFKPKILFSIITVFLISILFYYQPEIFYKIKSVLFSSGLVNPGYTTEGKIIGEYDKGLFIYSKFHHLQILTSINLFFENPFFGIGPKNFKNVIDAGWHPHNYSFQILAEVGIIGFVIFISTFFFLLFKFLKRFFNFQDRSINNELNIYLLGGFLLNMLPIPSGDFFNNWVNILIFMPVGYYLFYNEK
ncbi:O-antigen ligase family protein [Candidatus Pelagibacter sp.]|uniref:O-antigen ligase family protein n=1 Tax=Candidatus Pelagibacter sp. TaxID=2024849 RepID=UPI003F86480F